MINYLCILLHRWESLLLIALYVLYCVALYYNEFLEAWVNTLPLPFSKLHSQNINSTDANYIPLEERKLSNYATTTENNTNFHSNEKIISSIQRSYQSNKPEDEKIKNEVMCYFCLKYLQFILLKNPVA